MQFFILKPLTKSIFYDRVILRKVKEGLKTRNNLLYIKFYDLGGLLWGLLKIRCSLF